MADIELSVEIRRGDRWLPLTSYRLPVRADTPLGTDLTLEDLERIPLLGEMGLLESLRGLRSQGLEWRCTTSARFDMTDDQDDIRGIMASAVVEALGDGLNPDASYLAIMAMTAMGYGPNADMQRSLRAIGVEVLLTFGRCCCGTPLPPVGGRCPCCSLIRQA